MIYALIIVCAVAEPQCDVEHAVWAEQSDVMFDDMDECFASVRLHLQVSWDDIAELKDLGDHRTVVICTEATRPS